MSYVFSPPTSRALPIRGSSALFPVRRVYCVGRNYADHAIEMGHDPNKEPPFFFQKNPDNVVTGKGEFPYPSATKDVHHEIELVVALSKGGEDIPVDKALDHVFGYAVGLDMTRRDLQGEAKKMGRPWEVGKAFEDSAPCGEIVPASRDRPPRLRRDLAEGERQGGAEGRPEPADLEGAGSDFLPLRPVPPRRRATSS